MFRTTIELIPRNRGEGNSIMYSFKSHFRVYELLKYRHGDDHGNIIHAREYTFATISPITPFSAKKSKSYLLTRETATARRLWKNNFLQTPRVFPSFSFLTRCTLSRSSINIEILPRYRNDFFFPNYFERRSDDDGKKKKRKNLGQARGIFDRIY